MNSTSYFSSGKPGKDFAGHIRFAFPHSADSIVANTETYYSFVDSTYTVIDYQSALILILTDTVPFLLLNGILSPPVSALLILK